MDFYIQASSPRHHKWPDAEAASLDEAIEATFPLVTESAIMMWHQIPVLLGYKYDLSVMSTDLLAMLHTMLRQNDGLFVVDWPSNTFASRWEVSWTGETMAIASSWRQVVGPSVASLNRRSDLEMSKKGFLAEWKAPLKSILDALCHCGYRDEQIDELRSLREFCEAVAGSGVLYSGD